MIKGTFYLLFAMTLLLVASLACDKSTGPATSEISAYQIHGCQKQLLKISQTDSCFSYDFHEKLIVDFCATGNCCPDSNGFSFAYRIDDDTIYVAVADTAAPLCNCVCNYLLHMEFNNLSGYSYVFFCTREDYSDQLVLYSERVYRHW